MKNYLKKLIQNEVFDREIGYDFETNRRIELYINDEITIFVYLLDEIDEIEVKYNKDVI